ncbi:MAG: membrane-bound lytic murein transglycosylase MltF [Rugosibacter sp.]|nr:MAG: membrane-bound lytic murein transglycosylase MltF [Rugosibacter sp.]TBR09929.1 MAG: membrane-bound lytic murein transglycosylase MltF [Rugosibacter sp.]
MIRLQKLLCLLYCFIFCTLASCTRIEMPKPLPSPEAMGELVIAVREAPGFYQQEGATISGFEYDLCNLFAASLGVKARFVTTKDFNQINPLLAMHKVHMAASLPAGRTDFQFSQPIRSVGQWIVSHDDVLGPDDMAELSGQTVAVVAGSPLAQNLRTLDEKFRPTVIEIPGMDEVTLLAQVAAQKVLLAAVHDINFDLASNFYPELNARVRLPGKTDLRWAFFDDQITPVANPTHKQPDNQAQNPSLPSLRVRADAFIQRARADGTMARLNDRYFGHVKRINSIGITQFIEDTHRLLPPLRRHFYAAENLTGIDWRLLAALAYHESHWDPLATSATNVRGIMMLTEETADHLGVDNRLDPASSIRGGARYLAELSDQLPDSVKPPDRLWLALAAYNLGMGHLRGALAIAKDMHRDPNSWYEMKKVLPLLSRPEVYEHLKAGPARGGEAVILVENIRTYYNILTRFEPIYAIPFAAATPQAAGQVRLR